ncbi:MAG: hypothetical protein SH850_18385 [Planctomycetaceae bacterium]|nr:hypothetical protein [Planctomycetaceae bacterium]
MTARVLTRRIPFVPQACWTVGSLAVLVSLGTASADDARDRQRAALLEQMRELARSTRVEFADDGNRGQPQFVDKPVFRYDDQPRRFVDATLWVWTHEGRPVAFQKIEAKENLISSAPEWGYCCTSLANQRLNVAWSHGRTYQSQEAGIDFQPIPDAPAVAGQSAQRRRQLRELARNFSARILNNPRTNDTQEMRLLTTPILEYADDATKLVRGSVFAYSTNGTNPDLVIVLEARPTAEGVAWHFAPARMTTGGLTVKSQERVLWEAPFVQPHSQVYATWTFFQTSRITGKTE